MMVQTTAQPSIRRITTSDGVALYVQVKGTGTPCLYVHGGPGSGSYWMEKFSDGMLEKHFQVIYLDQRGVSRSTSPADGNYSMDRLVQDFEMVRQALGIERWLTLGHSFGGILQMGYVLRHPEAHLGMLMLNCSLSSLESFRSSWLVKGCEFLGIEDTQFYRDETIPIFERVGRLGGLLRENGLFWKMAYADQQNEAMMSATFDEIPGWNKDFEDAAMSIPDYFEDFTQAAAVIQVPVLWFYGKTDWLIGPEHYKVVHFPKMLMWGSSVGHIAILENKPDLDAAITAFRRQYAL